MSRTQAPRQAWPWLPEHAPLQWAVLGESSAPWGAWAVRWGQVLGLGSSCAWLAEVVTPLVMADDARSDGGWGPSLQRLAEAGVVVDSLLPTLLGLGLQCWPENPPMAGGLVAPGPPAREAALAWGLPALVAGVSPGGALAFAHALAPLVAMLDATARWWLAPCRPAHDPVRVDPLLHEAAAGPSAARLLDGLGGYQDQRAQRAALRRVLAAPEELQRLAQRFANVLEACRRVVPAEGTAACHELLDALHVAFQRCLSVARFWWMAAALHVPAEAPPMGAVALTLACEYLADERNWPGAWEVRRRGLAHACECLVSRWFQEGFILRVLHDCGVLPDAAIDRWLLEPPAGGLRWYGDWQGIPPDVDSLGLALDLASRRPAFPSARVTGWLAPLQASLSPEGHIPVWFRRQPDGPSTDDPELEYLGDGCAGALLGTVLGLLLLQNPEVEPLARQNLRRLMDQYGEGGFRGVYFYHPAYADHLFLRIHDWAQRAAADGPLAKRIGAIAGRIVSFYMDSQRLDGGWGSPQVTGWALSCLASTPAYDRLRRGIAYLDAWQQPDGAWPAEPFYLMPGRDGGQAWHRGTALTTAVCATGLRRAAFALGVRSTI